MTGCDAVSALALPPTWDCEHEVHSQRLEVHSVKYEVAGRASCWVLTSQEHDRLRRGFSFGFAANMGL
jgi:hypothetical protein